MTTLHPDALVTTRERRGVGRVLYHHPSLPAWVVDFREDRVPLAWMDELLHEKVGGNERTRVRTRVA